MKVRNFCIPILVVISAVGCGSKSPHSQTAEDSLPVKSASAKHVEAGTDLTFTCIDTFNETTLTLTGLWNSDSSAWKVSVIEKNKHGEVINTLDGLNAKPHGNDSWQMDVNEGSEPYARIVQVENDQATMYGRNRILSCKFN